MMLSLLLSVGAGAASIGGTVFIDRNCDGLKQPVDPALAGWKIYLRGVVGGQPPILDSMVTAGDGAYIFGSLAAGAYAVSIAQQAEYLQSTPHSVDHRASLTASDALTGRDFALKYTPQCDTTPHYDCNAGVNDQFDTGNGSETAIPSSGLLAEMSSCGTPLELFDTPANGACFGHTIGNCWTACGPIDAVITMRLRASSNGSGDDELIFGDFPDAGAIWRADLNTLLEWRTAGADVSWDPGDTMTLALDLAALPVAHRGLTNILAALQDGDLDLLIRDNTEIDYANAKMDGG